MAVLKWKEDSAGRLVLRPALWPRLGNLLSSLVWVAVLVAFLLPAFFGRGFDWESVLSAIFVFIFAFGGGLASSLLTRQIVVDQPSRTVIASRRLVGLPISSTEIPFTDISNVEYRQYQQTRGRSSHDAWRVDLITRDSRRIPMNWDGTQEEITTLSQKLAAMTGARLSESEAQSVSTAQEILDRMRGSPSEDQPGTGDVGRPMGEPHAPPPVAWPWAMPQEQTSQPIAPPLTQMPSTEMASGETPTEGGEAREVDPHTLSVADLEQRVQGDPMDGQARHILARKYHGGGRFDRAVALYQDALRVDPMNGSAQNDLGVALEQQRKRTEAEAAYRRAIALDPFSSTAHLNLGLLLRGMKRAAEASQEFYQARQNARDNAETRVAEEASTGGKVEPQLSRRY